MNFIDYEICTYNAYKGAKILKYEIAEIEKIRKWQ